jgi:protein-serine/threonine kinase
VRLADLGYALQLTQTVTEASDAMGTALYMAPEVIKNQATGDTYSSKVDVWSLGIFAYELASGKPPNSHESANKIFY